MNFPKQNPSLLLHLLIVWAPKIWVLKIMGIGLHGTQTTNKKEKSMGSSCLISHPQILTTFTCAFTPPHGKVGF